MEQIRYTNEDRSFRRLMGCMAAALVLFYMVCPVAPERWNDLYSSYGKTLIFAMAAIYFFKCRFKGCVEVKLVIAYTLWILVSRWLNTDFYLQNELELVISRVLCCVILPVGLLLEADEREKLLDFVIAIAGAYYLVSALLGLYACIFGVYFTVGPEDVYFGIHSDFFYNSYMYIVAWDTNRTISAVWFYLAWCMMAYEFFHCKNKLWRIPISICWFIFHLTLAFSFCRNIKLAASGNVAMLVILLGMKYIKLDKAKIKALIIVVLAVVSIPLAYKSFDVLNSASAAVYNAMDVDIERISNEYMGDAYFENASDGKQNFKDTRDLKKSATNLSRRGEIYESVIPTLKMDPMRMLIGKYSDKLMDLPQHIIGLPYYHMHNFFLQVLMLAGIIGLLLVAAFTVLLVIKMIRLFFSQSPEATLAVKTLTFPLAGIFVYGMFETILFTASADERAVTDFRELCFFLIAGIFLGYYYQIFPPKAKK